MARGPCTKGTSFLPLVAALKGFPDREVRVPKAQQKYFDEHIVVSGWYPERDFFVLIEALAQAIDPKAVGGDVWSYFGTVSAQRDIGDSQELVTEESRLAIQGVYRHFAKGDRGNVEVFVRRALKLWPQYHDTGAMELRGGRAATNSMVVRLSGFKIPLEGYVRLQVAYTEEFGRLSGVALTGKVLRSTAKGDPFCEWEYTYERTPQSEAFVRGLPQL